MSNPAGEKTIIADAVLNQKNFEAGYSILDELVGFCESKRTDVSVKHDAIIYKLENDRWNPKK